MKPPLSGHSQQDKTKVLMTNGSFWPALSNHRSWKPIIDLFLNGRLRQVLLYLMFFVAIGYIHATKDMDFK